MNTASQITNYLQAVVRYAAARKNNNPLETMPDIQAYPAIVKDEHARKMVDIAVHRIFTEHGIEVKQ